MLKEAIEIRSDALNLTIELIVKKKINADLAEPEEIIVMLKMYGDLREDIPMEISIDNETQIITLKFQKEEEFNKVANIFETIWDNAVNLLTQAIKSDFSRIKNIPNIDE
jgi:hypothetical protein